MSETPELVVYETFIAGDGHPGLRTRPATVEDVSAWLREQGAIVIQRDASGNWPLFLIEALEDYVDDPWTVQAVIERTLLNRVEPGEEALK